MPRTIVIGIVLATLVGWTSFSGCGARSEEVDSKRRRLEQLRNELARLQREIQALEAELEGDQAGAGREISVVVEPVRQELLRRVLEVQGTVESRTTVTLSTKSAGAIVAVRVQPGMRVSRGQVLVELDSEVLRRTLDEVQTQRDLARALYEKYKRAWEAQAIAEVQYLNAKQQWEALERRLETLREQLAQTRITAPFAGLVDEVMVKPGEFLAPGMPAVRLVNTSDLYVSAEISEAYAGSLKPGARAQVVLPELGDTVPARFRNVGQAVNPRTRTFRTELVLERMPAGLRPGLQCQVRVSDVERPNAVTIPLAALQQRNGVSVVYVVERQPEGTAVVRERPVRVGLLTFEKAEVLAGLRPGEEVVIRASGELRDGLKVQL
ncbi:MAG: efflux RND transporter periplasmic adaptor subunit [Chlorobiota bacterium]